MHAQVFQRERGGAPLAVAQLRDGPQVPGLTFVVRQLTRGGQGLAGWRHASRFRGQQVEPGAQHLGHHEVGGFGQRRFSGGQGVVGKAAELVQGLLQQVQGVGVAARDGVADGVFRGHGIAPGLG